MYVVGKRNLKRNNTICTVCTRNIGRYITVFSSLRYEFLFKNAHERINVGTNYFSA